MRRIAELAGSELKWEQPRALKREFELKWGEETVATLGFRSLMGSLAVVEAAEGNWTFKRVGFLTARVTVRRSGEETDLATFRNNTWNAGGTLELADGRRYRASTNFWMTAFEFKTETDETLVTFRRMRGAFHLSSNVEIAHAATRLAELPWLVALGWYLVVKMHEDAAAGGGAAAAGG